MARASSTGSVTTPDSGTVTIPLSGNSWTATATELNQLPLVGQITYTPPTVGGLGCDGNGLASLLISIEVNGQVVASGSPGAIPNGVQHTGGTAISTATIPEPGTTTTRTAVMKIGDTCTNPGDNFQIESVRFEVAGLR